MTYEEIYKLLRDDDTKVFALDKFELCMYLHDFEDREYTDEFIDKCYDCYQAIFPWEDRLYDYVERLYEISNEQNCSITELDFEKLKKENN